MSQESSLGSTPPPVLPKTWTVKKRPGGSESRNGNLEIAKPPIPVSRKQFTPQGKSEGSELSTHISPPQSPTKSPKGSSLGSTPPPVLPKTWTVKKRPGGSESRNDNLEIAKPPIPVSRKQFTPQGKSEGSELSTRISPPQSPTKSPKVPAEEPISVNRIAQPGEENEIPDGASLLRRWKGEKSRASVCKELELLRRTETVIIKIKANQLYKAVRAYILLLNRHGSTLKEHIVELLCITDNLDKVSKGTKIAGITGGTTTALGGVAAAAGVILCPLTLGASLALTVVGVGMAAAGGVTGASAAIANKVNVSQDNKKISRIFQEYDSLMAKIRDCLKYISEGMEKLKQHNLSTLSEARRGSAVVAGAVDLAVMGGASARALDANSKASGLIQGFATAMDFYFTQGKDGQKLKKGLKSKFAKKIRKLAEELRHGVDELMQTKDLFCQHCPLK